jgi:hypothetical protein
MKNNRRHRISFFLLLVLTVGANPHKSGTLVESDSYAAIEIVILADVAVPRLAATGI